MAQHSIHHSHKLLKIGVVLILIFLALVAGKLMVSKEKWHSYVVDSQKSVAKYKSLNSAEDAGIIATSLVNLPSSSNPVLKQASALEAYIEALGKKTGRDIVVLDTNKKILADTVRINVGTKYTYDAGGEILKTLGDRQPRDFLENSTDYPSGIAQTVVPITDNNGAIVGAIIISSSGIFSQ